MQTLQHRIPAKGATTVCAGDLCVEGPRILWWNWGPPNTLLIHCLWEITSSFHQLESYKNRTTQILLPAFFFPTSAKTLSTQTPCHGRRKTFFSMGLWYKVWCRTSQFRVLFSESVVSPQNFAPDRFQHVRAELKDEYFMCFFHFNTTKFLEYFLHVRTGQKTAHENCHSSTRFPFNKQPRMFNLVTSILRRKLTLSKN